MAARDGTPVSLDPGDLVTALPGEEHWHGAGPNGPMTHLAIQFGVTAWDEAVEEGD
jgi:quercetin dioxygenase-like cupin family protein